MFENETVSQRKQATGEGLGAPLRVWLNVFFYFSSQKLWSSLIAVATATFSLALQHLPKCIRTGQDGVCQRSFPLPSPPNRTVLTMSDSSLHPVRCFSPLFHPTENISLHLLLYTCAAFSHPPDHLLFITTRSTPTSNRHTISASPAHLLVLQTGSFMLSTGMPLAFPRRFPQTFLKPSHHPPSKSSFPFSFAGTPTENLTFAVSVLRTLPIRLTNIASLFSRTPLPACIHLSSLVLEDKLDLFVLYLYRMRSWPRTTVLRCSFLWWWCGRSKKHAPWSRWSFGQLSPSTALRLIQSLSVSWATSVTSTCLLPSKSLKDIDKN